jgi:outer membrane receptor protein involved in Fe transport
VDLNYVQELRFATGLKIKVSGRNLTDETWTWTQGGQDWRVYKPGRIFKLGVSYSL